MYPFRSMPTFSHLIEISQPMTTTPTNNLTQCVQKYSAIDDELHELSERQKILRRQKQDLESIIIKTMKDKNLENRTLKQGQNLLSIGTRKHYSALSFSYLERSFEKMVTDKDSRHILLQYLRENREVRIVDELKLSRLCTN
jgi:hypothetical protein